MIYRGGDEPNLRVLDLVVLDDPRCSTLLVVEPT
jgi:hypothetical protein